MKYALLGIVMMAAGLVCGCSDDGVYTPVEYPVDAGDQIEDADVPEVSVADAAK